MFYALGGFGLPFYVIGGSTLLLSLCLPLLLSGLKHHHHHHHQDDEKKLQETRVLQPEPSLCPTLPSTIPAASSIMIMENDEEEHDEEEHDGHHPPPPPPLSGRRHSHLTPSPVRRRHSHHPRRHHHHHRLDPLSRTQGLSLRALKGSMRNLFVYDDDEEEDGDDSACPPAAPAFRPCVLSRVALSTYFVIDDDDAEGMGEPSSLEEEEREEPWYHVSMYVCMYVCMSSSS